MLFFQDDVMRLDGGLTIWFENGPSVLDREPKYPNFIMSKTNEMLRWYGSVISGRHVRSMLEIGIMKGGSVVYFNETVRPEAHMAIDIFRHKSGLCEYAKRTSKPGRKILVDYEVDQSNSELVIDLYRNNFSGSPNFDLIIDDASHVYDLSVKTFNGLFKYVSPNGVYAIEDWGWAHWREAQSKTNVFYEQPALSNLVIQCILASTSGEWGIAKVEVTPDIAFIYRNDRPVPEGFDVTKSFRTRDRHFTLL